MKNKENKENKVPVFSILTKVKFKDNCCGIIYLVNDNILDKLGKTISTSLDFHKFIIEKAMDEKNISRDLKNKMENTYMPFLVPALEIIIEKLNKELGNHERTRKTRKAAKATSARRASL